MCAHINSAIYIANIANVNGLRKLFFSELCTSLRRSRITSPAPPHVRKMGLVRPCGCDTRRPLRHSPGVCTPAAPTIKGARGKRWPLFLPIFGRKLLYIIRISSTWNNFLNLFFFLAYKRGNKEYIRADGVFTFVNQRVKGARILHDCARLHECTNL